jgi:hypothetical protein
LTIGGDVERADHNILVPVINHPVEGADAFVPAERLRESPELSGFGRIALSLARPLREFGHSNHVGPVRVIELRRKAEIFLGCVH